jgi:hypothetical protein
MPGSLTQAVAPWPRPLDLALRALLSTVLVLVVVQVLGRPLVRAMLPVVSAVTPLIDPRFDVTDVQLARFGADDVVRVRGNLSRPLLIGDRIISPFGWNGTPAGGLQITYTMGGVLEYGALLLILVLAWPAASALELGCRVAIALPCAALLPMLIVPFTVVAEFRHGLAGLLGPNPPGASLIASRYLMGGGGWVIALMAAAFCIALARRNSRAKTPPPLITNSVTLPAESVTKRTTN